MYINTTVIIDYIIACRLSGVGFVIHVHELPLGITGTVLRAILRFSGGRVIFISEAVREAFGFTKTSEHLVIHNGTLITGAETRTG